ncbi:saccharopine dehydrogenase NADP-binding domain-containing protein [Acidianus sp. HS-5]|uniref:saccharopine dehydrogenase family protein n=1 Tax=Acidianus sp. HS-5 TaxID=2886040 RepID=UPI001F3A9089|nr:saccharopine dehydrogenase NADP-binding domain-containing protein [Acidianus sp. HS-5]BDC18881.1 saccharopine dehydrogenase [Acidianus sp. HS-5]
MKVSILGGSGLIGRVITKELMKDHDVTVIDIIKPQYDVNYVYGDLNNVDEVSSKIKNSDYVINAAQYYFNLNAMKASLKAGVNYMDLGGLYWMTRKQLDMNKDFEKENLLALVGMGAEPGITNVIARYFYEKFGTPIGIKLRDGWINYNDNIDWSIDTQMDEMTLDVPVLEKGEYRYYKPLSRFEDVEFSIGKIRVYLTIHSELATFPSSFEGVKFVDWMEGGSGFDNVAFLSKIFGDDIEVLGIRSRKYLREILKAKGFLGYKDEKPNEVEACKVIFEYDNREVSMEFNSGPKDEFDGTQYMTGISPVIAVNMKVKGEGVLPPEKVVNADEFMSELKRRGIKMIYQERDDY